MQLLGYAHQKQCTFVSVHAPPQHNPVEVPCLRWCPRKAGLLATALQGHAGATFIWEAPLLRCSVLAQSGALKAESTPMRVPEPSGRIGPPALTKGSSACFSGRGLTLPSNGQSQAGFAHL